MKIQNFPDIDLPTVTVTASLPGAAPAQMETEVARKIENSIATLQGLKHIYTKVQDGTATITVEFRLEKPTQEALDDVRDAVSRVRSDLPGDLRDPVITKVDLAGLPILTYTVASSAHGRRGAVVVRRQHGHQDACSAVRGVGAVARVGGVDARGARRARPGAAAGAERHRRRHLAPAAPGAAGGARAAAPTSAAPSSRCAPSPRCSRPRNWRRWRSRWPTAGACASTRWPRSATPSAEQRSAALLNGKPVVGFEITRARGAGEVDVAEGVRAALDELKAAHPDMTDHRGLQLRRSGDGELRRLDGAADRRRDAGGAGGLAVPARLARHLRLGRGAAAVGRSRPSP